MILRFVIKSFSVLDWQVGHKNIGENWPYQCLVRKLTINQPSFMHFMSKLL